MSEKMSFEEAMAALEECTERLSSQDTTLEESMALYSRGTKLLGVCQKALERAKLKIETLMPEETNESI